MLPQDCLPFVFCSTLLAFGMGGSRTLAASKIEHFVTKVNSYRSLLLLERAPSSPRVNFGHMSRDSLTNPLLITSFFKGHEEPCDEVGSLNPTECLWGLMWNPYAI